MLDLNEQDEIIALIKREVVPAIGCTEPVAVALCVARATELLGALPGKIEVALSANMLKNAMGVGIPGTGMIGLPIAIALGAICGRSEYGLEVLRDVNSDAVERGKRYVDENRISISLKKDISEKLYIEVVCSAEGHTSRAVIAGGHTRFVRTELDGEVTFDAGSDAGGEGGEADDAHLTLAKVYEFATTTPVEKLRFILEAARLNKAAAEASMKGSYGHSLGRIISGENGRRIIGDSIFAHLVAYTSGACDVRMGGAMVPVMSNSGSGNQGISATVPVVVYGEARGKSEEELIRALALSHLTVIYIKQKLGRLSALCGCVVAATGSSCGLTYLMGGNYRQVTYAVKNMVANLTGMICDGAKPSCALKVTSGVSTAVYSALMAIEDVTVSSLEGIVDDDVERSIANLTCIGSQAMQETDREILRIMLSK